MVRKRKPSEKQAANKEEDQKDSRVSEGASSTFSSSKKADPVDRILWIDRSNLKPNGYNPNRQDKASEDLLKYSIVKDGWTQPIVICPADGDGKHAIIDGEHRWRVSENLPSSLVPCVVVDKPLHDRIASTVRHNRARGSHGIEGMSNVIKMAEKEGMDRQSICEAMGITSDEYDRLTMSEDMFLAMQHGAGKDGKM